MQPGAEQGILPPVGNISTQKRAEMPSLTPSSMMKLKKVLRKVQVRSEMKRLMPVRRRRKGKYLMALSIKGMGRHKGGNIKCSKMHEGYYDVMGHLRIL